MLHANETGLGPLGWVRGEIDAAVKHARAALAETTATDGQQNVRFALTHLHQVRGALAIIGLDGPTRFAERLAELLDAVARGEIAVAPATLALGQRALAALGNYVDELAHGAADQALRLAPLYEEIAAAHGQALPCAADLFFPDLTPRPPRRETDAPAPSEEDLKAGLRGARARFERGLLEWLREPSGGTGATQMREAVAEAEALQASPAARTPWWIALGLMDALAAGTLPAEAAKRLCPQLGAQFRRATATPAQPVPERLLREMLYFLATLPATSAHQRAIRDTWRLEALLPAPGARVSDIPLGPLLDELGTRLASLRTRWDELGEGSAVALQRFADELPPLAEAAHHLGRPAVERLLAGLARFSAWLRRDPLQFSESIGLEVATVLLLLEAAFQRRVSDSSLAERVGQALARLETLERGETLPTPADVETLQVVQDAHEREALAQLSRELLSSLAHVEQTLDDYFRDPSRRVALAALDGPLRQIEGALGLLGDVDALALLRQADADIRRFAAADTAAEPADHERLAHRLSALCFHVEALQHRRRARSHQAGERPAAEAPDAADRLQRQDAPSADIPAAPADAAAEEATAASAAQPPAAPAEATTTPAGLDAELLAIFIEEADEVLATIGAELALARPAPGSVEHLATIRRGFHTLKGSSRMVGLGAFGEAAWAIEQTLNRWLQLDWRPTPALHELIDDAHRLLAAWVARLRAGAGQEVVPATLLAAAERLRAIEAPQETFVTSPPAAAAAEPQPAAEAAVDTAIDEAPPMLDPAPEPLLDLEAALSDLVELDLPEFAPLQDELAEPAPPVAAEEDARAGIVVDEVVGELPSPAVAPERPQAAAVPPESSLPPVAAGGTMPNADEAGSPASLSPAGNVRIGDVVISRPLYALYLDEAAQHLATLHKAFAARRTPAAPSLPTIRAVHTLAGISGTTGLTPLHLLGRALENALERLSENGRRPDRDELALFAESTERLQAMVDAVGRGQLPPPATELIERLERNARTDEAEAGHEPAAALADAAATEPQPRPAPASTPAAAAGLPEPARAMRDDIDEQLLPIFREEGADLIARLHTTLRAWQGAPGEAQHAQAVARLLHTLKGSARMAGAMTLGEQVHQLETCLTARLEAGTGTEALTEELAAGLDMAEQLLDTLGSGGRPAPVVAAAAVPPAAVDEGDGEGESAVSATLRVRADLIDRFVNQAGEIGVSRTRIEGELRTLRHSLLELTENVVRLRNQLREVELQAEVQMQSSMARAESRHADFDPLEMDRYTRLQELTRMMAESVNDVTTVQQNLLHNLDTADITLNAQARMARELQQALMQVRMVPFDSLADRLYRVVRRSAKELGKRANLDLRGGRIEVDRSVLEQMAAPLEHLLRNALAHGIETPAQRRTAGKTETGQITLAVQQEGNEIAIELSDDGAGLDYERIAARAREKGLLGADERADARRLSNFIFVPGFSTASELSAVSGRGVGMDVVKAQTAAAGGRIDLESAAGRGLTVRIHLPLTLAVTQALLVQAGGRSYAIPASMVAQVLELKPEGLRELREAGGTSWQGAFHAYRYLPRLLGDGDSQPAIERHNWVLLLRAGAQTLALHVDGLRGIQEIVVKGAGPQLARIVGMSGATVMGDGEVVLILNPVALAGRRSADDDIPREIVAAAPVPVPTVMVVDDSLTVRKITSRLLEREGYRVVTAKDGVDALEKLADLTPEVLLSDIEMPRMDGFDLVRNLRADARTRALPVIMITSRLADKHRRYASEVGVDHYLGKPYQEDELLALIARYTGHTSGTAALAG